MELCVQTITGANGGVAVGVDFDAASGVLATGDGGRELRLWTVDFDRGDDVLEAAGRARRAVPSGAAILGTTSFLA